MKRKKRKDGAEARQPVLHTFSRSKNCNVLHSRLVHGSTDRGMWLRCIDSNGERDDCLFFILEQNLPNARHKIRRKSVD